MQAHGFRVCFTPLFEVLFTFPSRYWSTIGLREVFSLGGWSRRIRAGFPVSRVTQDTGRLLSSIRVRDCHPLRSTFPGWFHFNDRGLCGRSFNPGAAETAPVWASPLSLATTRGITSLFSFPAGTEMFQFPAFASAFYGGWYDLLIPGCPIRISADPFVFADPRSFSQLVTSFFAFRSLGILHVPLVTFYFRLAGLCPRYRSSGNTPPGLINTRRLFVLLVCSSLFCLFRHVKDRLPVPFSRGHTQ